MKKALVMVCLVAGIALAGPKSFRVTLSEPTMVGGAELKAGEYQVQLNGDKVTMKRGTETAEANVKVETASAKYSDTSILYDRGNGKKTVEQIRIGGTNMKLVLDSISAGEASGTNRP